MSKTLLYRLFGLGKIPEKYSQQLRLEGIVLQEEGIGGSITFRNFRAPGRWHSWRRNWFSGSIVLTNRHFLAFGYWQPLIGVPWNHPHINALNVYLDAKKRLCIEYDASLFNESWSGEVMLRFSSDRAEWCLREIETLIRQAG